MERLDPERRGEQGFMLLAMVVAIFLVMLALAVAAPRMAKELQREREVEAVHRGDQYVRAIRVYYRKVGMYPGSIEQLEKTNNVRYLRQKYVDPMTGKADWRLIHVGEAKTTVKGFFGQPLMGLPASGAGGATGASGATGTTGTGSGTTSAFGSSSSAFGSSSPGVGSSSPAVSGSSSAFGSSSGSSAFGSSSASGSGNSTFGSTGTAGASGSGTGTSAGNGTGNTSSSGTPSGGAPFMGVGLPVTGDSMIVLNEQTTYPTWEFIYDPRIEQLYKSSGLGGGASPANSSSFGSPAGSSTGSSAFGSGTSNSGGLFGSSTSGSGTTGSGSTPTPTTTPAPQQ